MITVAAPVQLLRGTRDLTLVGPAAADEVAPGLVGGSGLQSYPTG